MPHLQLIDVSQAFIRSDGTRHEVLKSCSLQIPRGAFYSIVGPSGSGKTTLFNLIAGLAKPSSGRVLIDGTVVDRPSDRVAYMLQKDLLMPWRTALDNVTLGLEIRGVRKSEARLTALHYLQRYGLAGFENAYPSALSGGMRQRVALIRTLVLNPEIVLLDEPFSALDYQTRLVLEMELMRIMRDAECTTILVTHDIEEAIAVADTVVVLGGRPTSIKAHHDIRLTTDGPRTPILSRQAPEYREYHARIWADLDVNLDAIAT